MPPHVVQLELEIDQLLAKEASNPSAISVQVGPAMLETFPSLVVSLMIVSVPLLDRNVVFTCQPVVPSLEHVDYEAKEGDNIDEWLAEYCNVHKIPITATPTRVPGADTHGQYVFAAESPQTIYYVRMIHGTPLGMHSCVVLHLMA